MCRKELWSRVLKVEKFRKVKLMVLGRNKDDKIFGFLQKLDSLWIFFEKGHDTIRTED